LVAGGFASEPHEGPQEPRRDERRRRRGRRGGRRNRHRNGEGGYAEREQSGEDSQPDYAPAEQLGTPATTESELSHAVADLDAPPIERVAPAEVSPASAAEQPEAQRRRSTVREPASSAGAETAGALTPTGSQPSEPVVTETGEASEGERPRRTGWWSRRFAGG
jgi:ribonuclease E